MESARYDLELRDSLPALAALQPVFSPHAQITTHQFRGQAWFIAQDPVSLHYFRFGPTENRIVKLLDGRHTLRDIHLELQHDLGGEAPSFQDLVSFVHSLRSANLLGSVEAEKLEGLYKRVEKRRSQVTKGLLANFLFPQIPLVDPDRFLVRTLSLWSWLFRPWFLVVWVAVVVAGIVGAAYHVRDLLKPAEGILAPDNLLLLWLTFVGLKVIHEFAHAYLAKNCGAEVHRMGVMLLVFTPCAYVDVTGIWGVESKHRRALVACAGMMAELFIASGALYVWLGTEAGAVHTIAYNVIFIASVSSVLFNGNPLLRYDAYYILSDWAELPNLWVNARRYIIYLGRRYLLGVQDEPPTRDAREKVWLLSYGVLSFCYRTLVVVGIILFICSVFFGLGVVLGAAAAVAWLVIPLGKMVHYLLLGKATRGHRLRCVAVFVLLCAALVAPLARLPVAQYVYAPCALIEQERAMVRGRWGGFISQVHVSDGDWVRKGQLIATCVNDELDYSVLRTQKELEAAQIRLAISERDHDVSAAQAERYQIRTLTEELDMLRQRVASLQLAAPCDGRVVAPGLADTPGSFLSPGQPLALIARGPFSRIVVVMDQAGISDVQAVKAESVTVRFRSDPGAAIVCRVTRILPQATHEVPSPVLTNRAGGPVILDPSQAEGTRTLLPWFRVELELPDSERSVPLGATGKARFLIGRKPLFEQWYYDVLRLIRTRFLL